MNGWAWVGAAVATGTPLAAATWFIRHRNLHYWLPDYLWGSREQSVSREAAQHVFIAVCDHYEPQWGGARLAEGVNRVDRWVSQYPARFDAIRDSSGQCPQHTFFFPQEEYRPEYLDRLHQLCSAGYGEVEIHIHHDDDTAESLTEKLVDFRNVLADRHGLLHRNPVNGQPIYAFIHGNWALCNSRPDGRWCGVNNELQVLLETGCYADFTMPSAPSDTQTSFANRIYYARDVGDRPKSHDRGQLARVGTSAPTDHLLLIQGPLGLDWSDRKWGIAPRIENGDLHLGRPPAAKRIGLWQDAGVHVEGRPDWMFIKLHTHGCKPGNDDKLLGDEMLDMHHGFAATAERNPDFKYHYVTAFEMAQLVHQAEAGFDHPDLESIRSGNPCPTNQ